MATMMVVIGVLTTIACVAVAGVPMRWLTGMEQRCGEWFVRMCGAGAAASCVAVAGVPVRWLEVAGQRCFAWFVTSGWCYQHDATGSQDAITPGEDAADSQDVVNPAHGRRASSAHIDRDDRLARLSTDSRSATADESGGSVVELADRPGVALGVDLRPYSVSASASSQVAPSESGAGGGPEVDGEEKHWETNPAMVHMEKSGSVGV